MPAKTESQPLAGRLRACVRRTWLEQLATPPTPGMQVVLLHAFVAAAHIRLPWHVPEPPR